MGKTEYKYPPRKYQVPPGVLKPDLNTIAVRLWWFGPVGGFVEGKSYALEMGPQRIDLAGSGSTESAAAQACCPISPVSTTNPAPCTTP